MENDNYETDSNHSECETLALGFKYDCSDLVRWAYFNTLILFHLKHLTHQNIVNNHEYKKRVCKLI